MEAFRYLLHRASTVEDGRLNKTMMLNDVSRAFFEAAARRLVCCELPKDFPGNEQGDLVGLLLKSLYGTRDAAHNWVEEVAKFLVGIGFERGVYNPCIYLHREKGLELMVHGDDFVTIGEEKQNIWLQKKMDERFKMKTRILGSRPGLH